jgi:hypothetical protein
MKGVGRIHQQTFVDTYSKVAIAKLYDRKTALTAADLADRAARTPNASGRPAGPAFTRGNRRLGTNSASHYPGPLRQVGS